MSDPIRMLHFADTHIGVENYGAIDPRTGISSRVLDFLRRITDLIEFAEANDADLAIFAGDAFKSRHPSPTHQREFARRIKRLAEICPVVLLVGNHDLPAMTQKASSIEIFHTLDVPNIVVGRRDEIHWVETKRGPVQVATVPYPMRQRLMTREETAGMTIAQIDGMLEEVVGQIISNLAQEIDPSAPAVLTGHFSVSGAKLGSERGVMLGRDVSVLKSALVDPAWDYVALGHIHYHQNLTAHDSGAPPVVYCGSLERVDFGEEGDPKGFCWVGLERGNTQWEFVELAARPFVTIRADARHADDPTAVVLRAIGKHDVTDAVVRVLIDTTPENDALVRDRDIGEALGAAAHVAAIQHEIEYVARTRLDGASPEALTPPELLERYLIGKEVTQERAEVLMEHAEMLFREENEALADLGSGD
jgi:exonuclease SbcD